jgi:glutamine synthetase
MSDILNSSRPKPLGQAVSVKEFFEYAKEVGAEFLDLKFVDMLGSWQHCTYPMSEISEDVFTEGLGFDGSSIRGWQNISQSDMVAVLDSNTVALDPFFERPTLSVIADIVDPVSRQPYGRDPRTIARRAQDYLKTSGLADVAYFGPEPEFFVFDEVRFEQTQNRGYYEIDSVEGAWNNARFEEPNLGYKPSYKGGYFPVSPTDTYHDLRSEMVVEMMKVGIRVEAHHHEVATGGQGEIDMRYAPLVQMGDQMLWFKYIIKNVAKKYNKTVTFMPKPIFEDNGSGMHVHASLWKDDTPLFAGDKYADLSETALHAIGGILKHAHSVIAFTNPTTNSYHRLVPGYEAPVNLAYSARNRSASIRIPMYSNSPSAKRLEFRCPDPSCNAYLAFSAILMAMIDGVENKIDPGQALDRDIYGMSEVELAEIPRTPASLRDSLEALRADHAFLTKGNVFCEDVINAWIDYKIENEIKPLSLRPHPYEFFLYYDN